MAYTAKKKQTKGAYSAPKKVVKNLSNNRFRGAGLNLPAGESVELEEHILKNERAMAIIDRQVEIGRMAWVS